jgi:hypothetical protein
VVFCCLSRHFCFGLQCAPYIVMAPSTERYFRSAANFAATLESTTAAKTSREFFFLGLNPLSVYLYSLTQAYGCGVCG